MMLCLRGFERILIFTSFLRYASACYLDHIVCLFACSLVLFVCLRCVVAFVVVSGFVVIALAALGPEFGPLFFLNFRPF